MRKVPAGIKTNSMPSKLVKCLAGASSVPGPDSFAVDPPASPGLCSANTQPSL